MKIAPRLALAGVLLAAGGLLTACTGTGAGDMSGMSHASSTPAASHNAQDVTFAQMMIVHHEGAIEMADLAPSRADSTQVKDLATTIKAAQKPEIDEMKSWLKAWGEPTTMSGMDMSTSMPGMTAQGMDSLKSASGVAFDKQFLTLMIEHHQGAITMAEEEQSGGKDGAAKKLANDIVSSQTNEVADMKAMLSALG